MADNKEPPPLFDEDDDIPSKKESEDLFPPEKEEPAVIEKNDDKKKEVMEDLFADADEEVPLDSPADNSKAAPHTDEPPLMGVTQSDTLTSPTKTTTTDEVQVQAAKTPEEIEEEESGDTYSIEISVTQPKKMGDGMNAYMAYKVNTKTTIPQFRKSEVGVYRRFSDFLGLHEKLTVKHQAMGKFVPPPPEKSVLGMTKIKMSKEESGSADFVEKRRASLERYLNRTAKHPDLRYDPDFRDFLQTEGDLPKSTSTSALSGAGVLRLFSKVGDSFGKMTFKMDETDQWFEEKQQQVEALDTQLKKLHSSIEALVMYRKELAVSTGSFAKSAAMLGNVEEHTALSRALSQLAEIEEKMDQLHLDQADSDFFTFSELVKDYICLIGSVKAAFHERVKCFKNWKDAETVLAKKRENKAKLELAHKSDKIPQAEREIQEGEKKVEMGQEEFERISKTIRKEFGRFERQRVRDFKATIINYLESLMNSQQKVIKYWESFLPEAKAIA